MRFLICFLLVLNSYAVLTGSAAAQERCDVLFPKKHQQLYEFDQLDYWPVFARNERPRPATERHLTLNNAQAKTSLYRPYLQDGGMKAHSRVDIARDEDAEIIFEQPDILLLNTKALQGDPEAQFRLADIYETAWTGQRDYGLALALYKQAAKSGHLDAIFSVGWFYEHGLAVERNNDEALKWYVEAALKDHARSQFAVGIFYSEGYVGEPNYQVARKWFEAAAAQDHVSAMFEIGWMEQNGHGTLKSDENAREWYLRAAKFGNLYAQYNLGHFYYDGTGVAQDHQKAAQYYEMAAQNGDGEAQYELAFMYYDGIGVPHDPSLAHQWFLRAARNGAFNAKDIVAQMYEEGDGTRQNLFAAKYWYDQAARDCDADALTSLGRLIVSEPDPSIGDVNRAIGYFEEAFKRENVEAGEWLGFIYEGQYGVAQDREKAADYYDRAVQMGSAFAAYQLAYGLSYGAPTGEEDFPRALKYYEIAGERGNASAYNNLGVIYNRGQGVPTDHERALSYWHLAAEQGEATAMFNLGDTYHYGNKHVEVDLSVALEWYELAANNGDNSSPRILADIFASPTKGHENKAKALKYFQLSFDLGDLDAGVKAASYLLEKESALYDVEAAKDLLTYARDMGDLTAASLLAQLYENGDHFEPDFAVAARFYKDAAAEGDVTSQLGYAHLAFDHPELGLSQDLAIEYCRSSAANGLPEAQFLLAELLANAQIEPVDNENASKWYALAAMQGHEMARQALTEIFQKKD